jgi:hypothetical protein
VIFSTRTIRIDLSKLHGEFKTKDTCEESRLLEDASIDTGRSCFQRYLGKEITIDRYELIAMSNAKKTILNFDNKVECEDALKNGFVYFDEDFQKHTFKQLGSTGGSKIIGSCITKKAIVCENNK